MVTFALQPEAFNICNYPFLFNASAKTTLLQTDQAIQMHTAMQNAANSVKSKSILITVNLFLILIIFLGNPLAPYIWNTYFTIYCAECFT